MTQAHVAHDCRVGDGNIFANAGTLAGHVTIGNHTTIGAYSAVHQFCRVGDYAFIGGFTVVTRDALPFMKTVGSRGDAKSFGPNRVGLERKGFSKEDVEALVLAHKRLLAGDELFADKLARVDKDLGSNPKVAELLAFIRATQRGIILG
jgi:UDP-N-acetylglucosamine acyltransferase